MSLKKGPTAAEIGRLGGLKGGQSKSPAKQAASRRNAEKARAAKKPVAISSKAV